MVFPLVRPAFERGGQGFREGQARWLERALADYVDRYNEDWPHQGIGNRPIAAHSEAEPADLEKIIVGEKQGGILKSYRAAA